MAETAAGEDAPPREGRRRSPFGRLRLKDMRVRSRLCAVMAIPLLAASVLGGLRVNDSLSDAERYEQFHQVAALSHTGTELVQQLQRERDVAVDPAVRDAVGAEGLARIRQHTSELERRFRHEGESLSPSERLSTRLGGVDQAFSELPKIRTAVDHGLTGPEADTAYLQMIMSLLGIDNELDGQLNHASSHGWALYTLSLSTSMLSSERALASQAVASGSLSAPQRAALLATMKIRDMAQREFAMSADKADLAAYRKVVSSPESGNAEKALQALLGAPEDLSQAPALPASWYEDFGTRVTQLDKLALHFSDGLVSSSKTQYDDAVWQARLDAAVTAALLVAALALAFAVSRSISRGLSQLRDSATDVAEVRLPRLMRDLQGSRVADVDLTVPANPVTTRDEIGEVAQAFDAVHREAVRLAGDQAQLREAVSTLFRNLSHRNQTLVQRQLLILTALEQNEEDGAQLKRLFELDHLATRMRRNSENLLVLAGGSSSSRVARPMPLLDVLRTAMSEVEQFERVSHFALPPVQVAGYAVSDIAHLISELLENALMFSSPQNEVQVSSQRLPDGRVLVEIRDFGIGMDARKLELANGHFAQQEALAPDASEHMGLYVVGLLARRHGVEVSLRAAAPGTSAMVILPADLCDQDSWSEPGTDTAAGQVGRSVARSQALPARGEEYPAPGTSPDVHGGEAAAGLVVPSREALPQEVEAVDGPGGAVAALPAADPGEFGEPSHEEVSGLPRRVPMANLRPGSIPGPQEDAPQAAAAGRPAGSAAAERGSALPAAEAPERLRSRLGALHRGIARAGGEKDYAGGEVQQRREGEGT
ncbi:sensor histidine kinase [Streptomyces wuyuanensis]|uniref:sensor histidine kinase n=1 Tax=Streptomyces wuyuanensis TaxID=1196353 RepID=UPI0034217E53